MSQFCEKIYGEYTELSGLPEKLVKAMHLRKVTRPGYKATSVYEVLVFQWEVRRILNLIHLLRLSVMF